MSTHVEIESKFDVDGVTAIDGWEAIAGVAAVGEPVEQQLDAQYFDTADLRLVRAGIGLRRRVGGEDSGWHLKIERSRGERLEVRRPLGRSSARIPKALRDLIVVHGRDHELAPVARLQTRRVVHRLIGATGEAVAEIADDEVTSDTVGAGPSAWREIEVELIGTGDRDLLRAIEEHLRAAGARPATSASKLARALAGVRPVVADERTIDRSSTAGEVVVAYLRQQHRALVEVDPAVRVDAEDAVHSMRVAVRRLRSGLASFRRLLDTEVTEPLRDELKWLGGVLGPVRDAEVIRDHLRTAVAGQPARLVVGPVRRRIDTTLSTEHRDAHQRALVALSSARYFAVLDAVAHLADVVQGQRARHRARTMLAKDIRRTHDRVRRAVDEAVAGSTTTDEQLHEVRKAIKRARYTADVATVVLGSKADRLSKRMVEGQEMLGDHQDSVVIRHVLRRLATDAEAASEPSFTYGHLHALEERRGERAAADFLARVDDGWAKRPSWLD